MLVGCRRDGGKLGGGAGLKDTPYEPRPVENAGCHVAAENEAVELVGGQYPRILDVVDFEVDVRGDEVRLRRAQVVAYDL